MDGSSTCGKGNNSFIYLIMKVLLLCVIDKIFQILLESVNIGAKRYNPIVIESFGSVK